MTKRDTKEENDAQGLMYRIGIVLAGLCLLACVVFGSLWLSYEANPAAAFTGVVLCVVSILYLCNLAWDAVAFRVHWD